uniref:protein-tyrosine-phosphatase n=1 Tax=Palpitomonas bilix TaxID=652834 RepID=A0A7S3GEN9_9EUKA|mmetsp:Transcript_46330/g.119571  ORF Transcript_46330/g.119571 Transcript_46330/m.119571 type:complete len:218 (+) Transcript_46330:173-826(+)
MGTFTIHDDSIQRSASQNLSSRFESLSTASDCYIEEDQEGTTCPSNKRIYETPARPLRELIPTFVGESPAKKSRRACTTSRLSASDSNILPSRERRALPRRMLQLREQRSDVGSEAFEDLLPTVDSPKHNKGKHNHISGQTLCDLLDGKYSAHIEGLDICDCRFPYEYDGGCIKSAIHFNGEEDVADFFFEDRFEQTKKPRVIVFYCEFSQARGPSR